jgi:hypothetical protein
MTRRVNDESFKSHGQPILENSGDTMCGKGDERWEGVVR